MHKLLRILVFSLMLSITMLGGMVASYAVEARIIQDSTSRISTNTSAQAKRGFLSSWVTLLPARSAQQADTDKQLSNVKIFPNPVTEYINLSYRLSKTQVVKIKVMDALGNEVLTLLNQRIDAGNQNHSFEVQNRLSTGIYFVRVSAGTETIVKRISVL
jgi:hypothetical protein